MQHSLVPECTHIDGECELELGVYKHDVRGKKITVVQT